MSAVAGLARRRHSQRASSSCSTNTLRGGWPKFPRAYKDLQRLGRSEEVPYRSSCGVWLGPLRAGTLGIQRSPCLLRRTKVCRVVLSEEFLPQPIADSKSHYGPPTLKSRPSVVVRALRPGLQREIGVR